MVFSPKLIFTWCSSTYRISMDIIFSDPNVWKQRNLLPGLPPESQKWHWARRMCLSSFESGKTVDVDRGLFHCNCCKIWPPGRIPGTVASCRGVKESQLPSTSVQSATSSGLSSNTSFLEEMNHKKFEVKIAEAWTNQWCSLDFLILPIRLEKAFELKGDFWIGMSGLNRQTSRLILASWLQKQPRLANAKWSMLLLEVDTPSLLYS